LQIHIVNGDFTDLAVVIVSVKYVPLAVQNTYFGTFLRFILLYSAFFVFGGNIYRLFRYMVV